MLSTQHPTHHLKKTFDVNIETLRGVAALVVVWSHSLTTNSKLAPHFVPTGIWTYVAPSHLSVLVFFLLSGYVIGLTNKIPLTPATIRTYLKKRVVRLYPIYLFCLVFALAVSVYRYPFAVVWSQFTLMQGLLAPVIQELSPAWSLTYEVVFYLLFIPISAFRISPLLVALSCLGAGCVNAYLCPGYGVPLFSSYAFGFGFWLSGLCVAQYCRRPTPTVCYASMVSALCLLLSLGQLDAPVALFHRASLYLLGKDLFLAAGNQPSIISFWDVGYLPYCLLILLLFASREFPYRRYMTGGLLLLPALTFYSVYTHRASQAAGLLVLPSLFYGLALLFFVFSVYLQRASKHVIIGLVSTGSISYALYLVHYPVIYLFNRIAPFTGGQLAFIVRLGIFLALSVVLAYVLEKKFQPYIRRLAD